MRTIKLTVAYDGTNYAGWQRQNKAPTIQGLLESALHEIEGRTVTVFGASRTDAGVHALGQAASFQLSHLIDMASLVRALNAKLPNDIRVLQAEEVPGEFHARFAATYKTYRYRIQCGSVANPLERGHAWHITQGLNIERMQQAGAALCGRHDFAAFQTSAGVVAQVSTVRTIFKLKVSSESVPHWLETPLFSNGTIVNIDVTGDGFLRHMVRAIVGTVVEVGAGRAEVSCIGEALTSRRREKAGPTAPAHGLFLVKVWYEVSS